MWDISCKRNGHGIQEWPDGCKYEGEFINNLKHGDGVFTWTNGESYKGSFFKDYRHGKGTYSWPDGSKYTGKFYLNRKEGYGVQVFPDGSTFQGLYHAGERFGPGVMTYPDGRQDLGLWHREKLLQMCSTMEDGFSLEHFPEYMTRRLEKDLKQPLFPVDVESRADRGHYVSDLCLLEDEDHFILPPEIERYSTDSDHLPIPRRLRRELDLHFFGTSEISTESLSIAVPLQQRLNAHIQRHRFEAETLDWDVAAVLNLNRAQFGPKGPLELNSERLIMEASRGECRNVYRILRDGEIHPDVSDAKGHTALIAATVYCHDDVINMLLDNGADVNKLNAEGMSALAVCMLLYYPLQSLHETLAEKVPRNISPEPQIKPLEDVAHESSPDPVTETARDESEPVTSETNQTNPRLEPENLEAHGKINDNETVVQLDELNTSEEIDKNTDLIRKETLLELENEQNIRSQSVQVLDDLVPVGCVSWKEAIKEEDLESSVRSDDPDFNSACSMLSFQIEVTEEILQKSAEILSLTQTLSPTDTQETVRRIALLKTEHRKRWATVELLLERGADPNSSTVPVPVIFLAIKAAHVNSVRRLLECGARTDIPLPPEQKGLYPLHIAAGLLGAEGPEITELLLHALADPNHKALDQNEVFQLDQVFEDPHVCQFSDAHVQFPQEGGRTALHVACQRDSEYTNARDVVALLLSHCASPNEVWSGHSPLSLAIASGNHLAVDELLSAGADVNLPLTRHIGSALCALTNINYDHEQQPRNHVKLLDKLVKAGADVLMPVMVCDGRRCTMGTVVDYAHITFQQNRRMSRTPYHALSKHERHVYNARRQLLGLMGDLMRQTASRGQEEQGQDEFGVSPSERSVYSRSAVTSSLLNSTESISRMSCNKQRAHRKWRFCEECGRSVGVHLTACSRCHEVYYCSNTCRGRAWEQRHREKCVRLPVVNGKSNSGRIEPNRPRSSSSPKDAKANPIHPSISPEIQEYDPNENYSFI